MGDRLSPRLYLSTRHVGMVSLSQPSSVFCSMESRQGRCVSYPSAMENFTFPWAWSFMFLLYSPQISRPFRVCWRVQVSWGVYVWTSVLSSTYFQRSVTSVLGRLQPLVQFPVHLHMWNIPDQRGVPCSALSGDNRS